MKKGFDYVAVVMRITVSYATRQVVKLETRTIKSMYIQQRVEDNMIRPQSSQRSHHRHICTM